jgi:hypothetical protein
VIDIGVAQIGGRPCVVSAGVLVTGAEQPERPLGQKPGSSPIRLPMIDLTCGQHTLQTWEATLDDDRRGNGCQPVSPDHP